MSKLKIREELVPILGDLGFDPENEMHLRIYKSIRGGKNLLIEDQDEQEMFSVISTALLQLIPEPGEGSPRAIIIVKDDETARNFHARLENFTRKFDLTVDLVVEKGNMLQQRNDLFDGTEIIIGTPQRLFDLYIQNGFNIGKVILFVLFGALEIMRAGKKMQISRITESLPNCRRVLLSYSFSDSRIEEFIEEFLPVYETIEA